MCHAFAIVVVGRGQDQIDAVSLIGFDAQHCRIEDGFLDARIAESDHRNAHTEVVGQCIQLFFQPFLSESWLELRIAIMMMDAVGKPDLLHVLLEGLPLRVVLVALIMLVHRLANMADRQVVAAVLVPKDVASPQGSLCQIIDQSLLLQVELFESRHFVAKHLDVGKTIDTPRVGLRGVVLLVAVTCCCQ